MRLYSNIILIILSLEGVLLGSERISYFVIPDSERVANLAQEVEYYTGKYIEKRMMIPAEITSRELAVFEDEINRQNQEASALIAEAKKLYEEFKLEQCFFVFQKIVQYLERGAAAFEKSKDYQLALMYIGNIYQLNGDVNLAKETFNKLLIYNNKYSPDSSYFSPDIIETFENVKRELKNLKKGTIQIVPRPEDSQVYLDGSFIGSGVFKVDDLAIGEHIIGIKKRGYLPYTRKIKVQADVMELINIELAELKEISERYTAINKLKESDISTQTPPIIKEYNKDANATISVIIFLSGKEASPKISGYTFYRDRLVSYEDIAFDLSKDESRKRVIKKKTDELLNRILPDNIQNLTPVQKISHKKFYNSWWFYSIVGAGILGLGAIGYLILNNEEKENNNGALIISF